MRTLFGLVCYYLTLIVAMTLCGALLTLQRGPDLGWVLVLAPVFGLFTTGWGCLSVAIFAVIEWLLRRRQSAASHGRLPVDVAVGAVAALPLWFVGTSLMGTMDAMESVLVIVLPLIAGGVAGLVAGALRRSALGGPKGSSANK